MTQKTLNKADLREFTGTEQWYRHGLARSILYTDGAKYVAETGGAYWLLDEMAFAQALPRVKAEPFQHWRLTVMTNHAASLTCDDGNGNIRYSKQIEYTDFPLAEIDFYCVGNVIMLPSEY